MIETTICIPTHNHVNFLEQAVVSAATQTQLGTTVLIADDASTDGTSELAARLVSNFSNVFYHRHLKNLGRTANADWVLRQPKTEFVARLDSDDYLAPHYIEELLCRLHANPKAGYGHVAVTEIDGNGGFLKARELFRTREFEDADTALRKCASGYRVAANILLFRREALQSVNYLDLSHEDGEDYDLAIRLADSGWGNVYCSQPLAFYRVFGGTQWSYQRVSGQLRGYARIYGEILPEMFKQRRWAQHEIVRSRRQRACYACSLYDYPDCHDLEEKARVTKLIEKLDRSWMTRALIWISCRGGSRWVTKANWWQWEIKRLLKRLVLSIMSCSLLQRTKG